LSTSSSGNNWQSISGFITTFTTVQLREFYIHKARLDHLLPSTTYYYQVGDAKDGWSAVSSFTTISDGQLPLKFAVFGDFGVVNNRILPLLTKQVQQGMFDMAIHIGDMAYNMDEDNSRQGDRFMRARTNPKASATQLTLLFVDDRAYFFNSPLSSLSRVSLTLPPSPFCFSLSSDPSPLLETMNLTH